MGTVGWLWAALALAGAQEVDETTTEVAEDAAGQDEAVDTDTDADAELVPTAAVEAEANASDDQTADDVQGPVVAPAPEEEEERLREAWEKDGLGFGGFPFVNYSSDSGVGFGAIGNIYGYNGKTAPYSWTLGFLVYLSTRGAQTYRFDFDALEVGGLPLRINARLAFDSVRNDWYCELGTANSCDPGDAEAAIAATDLTGEAAEEALGNFYRVRYLRPGGFLNARYMLRDKPHRVEIMAGWWGEYYLPGTFRDRSPYAHSLYAGDFPQGEQGFSSNLQLGVMVDNRDNEPAPTKGHWSEVSIRGASKFWGSAWNYFGYNLTARTYVSHPKYRRFVWAQRLVHDGIVGNPNTIEMSRAGGSVIYDFYGGQRAGRGVRFAGVNGRVRFMAQEELRWTFLDTKIGKVPFGITLVGFSDIGFWAEDWSTILTEPRNPVVGFGGGLRLAFNQNFILRGDFGFSKREQFAPGIYLDVANLF